MRGENELAIADATRAIAVKSDDGVSFRIRGLARMELKDYEGALADLDAAIKLEPKDADSFAARGKLKEIKGDLEAGKLDLAKAIQLEPTNVTAIGNLAIVKRKTDDVPGASRELLKWTECAPTSSAAFYCLGSLQNDSLQYTQALKSFRKAIELDEKNYYPRFGVWTIRTRLGERDAATKELRASLQASGEDDEHEWELCIGRFLSGDLSESNLIAQANDGAKHPTEIPGRQCEAYYYIGIKELLEGNERAAMEDFKKSLAAGPTDYTEYFSAKAELQKLKKSEGAETNN
jgi:lipoprotein NlpI